MKNLLIILILILIILLGSLLSSSFINLKLIEGNDEFQPYDSQEQNPLFLATKNAANIQVLNDRLNNFNSMKKQLDSLNGRAISNTKQIQGLSDQITQFSQSMTNNDSN